MKRLRLSSIPPAWRPGVLVTVALVALLLGWLLFLRPGGNSGGGPVASPTPPPRAALGKTVTYSDYKSAVQSALGEIHAAKGEASGSEARKQHLQAAASLLEKVEGAGVEPPGAGRAAEAEIDNTATITALRADQPNVDALESRLDTLASALEQASSRYLDGTKSGDDAYSELRQVLSDQAFNYEQQLSPLQRLIRWLQGVTGSTSPDDAFTRLLVSLLAGFAAGALTFLASERLGNRWRRLGVAALVGAIVAVAFFTGLHNLDIVLELVAVVGLVVAAVAMGLFTVGVNRGRTSAAPRALSDLAAVLGMNAVEARRRAGVSASEGDYRSAIRYRCLAVLLALDEAGKLAFDRTATNREYLFRASGTLHDELQPLLDRFDDVWYGGAPAAAPEWDEYTARAGRVEAQIGGVGATGAGRSAA